MARIARLMPTLSESELKVLIALVQHARPEDDWCIRISAAELSRFTGLSREAVLRAIGINPEPGKPGSGLAGRKLLGKRKGTTITPSSYRLEFMRTAYIGEVLVEQGGDNLSPPPGDDPSPPPSDNLSLPLVIDSDHPGDKLSPPPIDSEGLAGDDFPVDIDTKNPIIDRLLKATPEACDSMEILDLRKWVHGYQCKFGRDKAPHPPDRLILAQLLAVAPIERITHMIQDLMAERKEPGYSYAWYVTVALQRIHGIQPKILKARRAGLKLAKRQNGESPDPEFVQDIGALLQRAGRGLK